MYHSCADVLHGIHQAGYLHGNLAADKLLFLGFSGITVIGFSRLTPIESDGEQVGEVSELGLVPDKIQRQYLEHVRNERTKRRHVDTKAHQAVSANKGPNLNAQPWWWNHSVY
jgi:hypothetical protein